MRQVLKSKKRKAVVNPYIDYIISNHKMQYKNLIYYHLYPQSLQCIVLPKLLLNNPTKAKPKAF